MKIRLRDQLDTLAFTVVHAVVYMLAVILVLVVWRWIEGPDPADCMRVCGERGVLLCDPPKVRCGP